MKFSRFAVLVASGFAFTVAAASPNIAVINMQKTFQGYYKTVHEQKALTKQSQVYQGYIKGKSEELEGLRKAAKALRERSLNIALSEKVQEQNAIAAKNKEQELKTKAAELKEFAQEKSREMKKRTDDIQRQVVLEIKDFVGTYARREGFDFVLDNSGLTINGISSLVYYSEKVEITAAVLAELNRGHESEVKEVLQKLNETDANSIIK
jgi:Skp family chaperone for outer membrane proteins